jgi:hypothetical protein
LLVSRPCVEHRLDNLNIAGAAANISRQHLADAIGIGVWFFAEQNVRRGEYSGRAESTLQRVVPAECRLQRAECVAVRKALDRRDVGAIGLLREYQA